MLMALRRDAKACAAIPILCTVRAQQRLLACALPALIFQYLVASQ